MPADYLILKKRGHKFRIKITERMRQGRNVPPNCDMEVKLNDYHDVALFLEDLKMLWNCPMDKAIEEYKRNQAKYKKGAFW